MAWIEPRGKKHLVVWREDGVKHSKSFGAKRDAQVFRNDIERRLLLGTLADVDQRKLPFEAYATVLFEGDGIRAKTREAYLGTLRNHLAPRIGHYTLEELQPARVRAVLAEIFRETSAWTVDSCHRVLSRVFRQALVDGIIHRNPLEGYRPPKTQRREIRILTPEEVELVANEVNPRFRVMVLLSAWGGFRIGELGGLRREDIDFGANTIAVRRAVSTPGGKPELGPPKTPSSRRVVTMPAWVMAELAEHLLQYPGEYVFSLPQGGMVTHTTFTSHYWTKACIRVGLMPPPRFHDLRHTGVALAIHAGAHPKLIQARLGHSSITMTMDTYGHLFPSADAGVAASLERFAPQAGQVIELRGTEG